MLPVSVMRILLPDELPVPGQVRGRVPVPDGVREEPGMDGVLLEPGSNLPRELPPGLELPGLPPRGNDGVDGLGAALGPGLDRGE